ncbi:hypothetical protein ACZ90_08670 [Streptomyces albus subsp. albus]|nr:hypothetical protein ACZ90_08670 [Streptomyces albus subsp. albus]
MSASQRSEPVPPTPAGNPPPDPDGAGGAAADSCAGPSRDDSDLLTALLNGMDAGLFALDADGAVTHWNREAERILGWSAAEAIGRRGLGGWAARGADAGEMEDRLLAAMVAPGRQVHEFPLLTRDGGRVLVRAQASAVQRASGRPAGVYCAFSEAQTQMDLERSVALSEALLDNTAWGVVVVDADLRPAVVNSQAAHALRTGRSTMLGRPLGDLLSEGVEEVEAALQHVLAEGAPPAPAELWVSLRGGGSPGAPARSTGSDRRCWRSGFLRLSSPLAEEPVPLGVAWVFLDITDSKRVEQESARLRFRSNQLHRAARAAAECEDPVEAATVQLDFALAGFADHALIDLVLEPAGADGRPSPATPPGPYPSPLEPPGAYGPYTAAPGGYAPPEAARPLAAGQHPGPPPNPRSLSQGRYAPEATHVPQGPSRSQPPQGSAYPPRERIRLVRAVATPSGVSGTGPSTGRPVFAGGIPVPYMEGHPALQAAERCGSVRASSARLEGEAAAQWAFARKWPEGTVHGLCAVLRSRGRTLGVATFLRGGSRRPFDRADAVYAEDVSVRVAAALDLARQLGG